MEAVQCARIFSRLWTAFSVSLFPCGVSAFLDSLCAAVVGSACCGAVLFSPRAGWRRCAASLASCLLVPLWLSVWSSVLCLCLAARFGLGLSQPGFWLFRLDHHLLWQVAPLFPTLSVFWCPIVECMVRVVGAAVRYPVMGLLRCCRPYVGSMEPALLRAPDW